MPGRKMDPMRARALASRMRKQYPNATTGQLKGMLETGQPMGEDPMKLRGMSPTGYQGPETGPAYRPISELSEMELNQLGITRKDPMEPMRRMESSVAYGESDPMTGMTETDAFPESRQPSYMDKLNAKSRSMMGTGPSYTDTMRDTVGEIASSPAYNDLRQRVRSGLNQVGKLMPGGRLLEDDIGVGPFGTPGYMDRLNAKSRSMMGTGPSYTDTMRDMMDTADMPAMARGDFMEDLIESTDYGNAYADTIATRRPDTFKSVDDLAEVPMMYDTAIEKAFGLYNRMGKVPPSVAVEVGRLAGLMDVKRAMEDMDSESLRQSMLDDRKDYVEGKEIQPAIDDFGDRNAR